ncbi:MAG: zinc-ribbon domain-containing protein [Deltaproteobacteria bacterium]|nr:zinc-ribbon domain-containing protein [Deltaproteobacteria bacterium]
MEWHATKNAPLTPSDVTPGSNKKVWWACPKGHEWQAKVNDRNYRRTGCPYCSGRRVCIDNSLQTVNPTLAREWPSDAE